jgi:hypothetical protein
VGAQAFYTCGRCTSRLSQVFSTLVLRKAATALSFGVAATFLLLAGYLPRDDHRGHVCAVAFLTLAVAGLGVGSAGWDVNALGAWAALFRPVFQLYIVANRGPSLWSHWLVSCAQPWLFVCSLVLDYPSTSSPASAVLCLPAVCWGCLLTSTQSLECVS